MQDTACRILFGKTQGDETHRYVASRHGGKCPCFEGRGCPLMDAFGRNPLMDDDEVAFPAPRTPAAMVVAVA